MGYEWSTYEHRFDAQKFGEAIEKLTSDGSVTPARVVEYARPEDSPIHEAFNWDDLSAAESWRKQQARQYLSSVRVVVDEVKPERVLWHVNTQDAGDLYVTSDRIASDAEMQAALMRQAMQQLRAARERYRDIEALAGVWHEVDQLELTA